MGVIHGAPEFVIRMMKSSDIKNSKQFLDDFNKQVLEIIRTANLPITKADSLSKNDELVLPPLDKKRFQYTLVLDLDETLVHFEAAERKFRLRPGCLAFLRALAHPYYEIVVFTAASQDYADFILNVLDPDRNLILHRLYRQHTLVTDEGIYLKDLSRLGRDLSKTIIVDNIRENFENKMQMASRLRPGSGTRLTASSM